VKALIGKISVRTMDRVSIEVAGPPVRIAEAIEISQATNPTAAGLSSDRMITFSGITFDLAAAINLVLGGCIAVIGGLVAAQIQARATRDSTTMATAMSIAFASEQDQRQRRRERVDPVLAHGARLLKGYSRLMNLAKAGEIEKARISFEHIIEELDGFDDISLYLTTDDDFTRMYSGFTEYVREAQQDTETCLALRNVHDQLECLKHKLPIAVFKVSPMLANLTMASERYIYGETLRKSPDA
jgi:hypothetical protein